MVNQVPVVIYSFVDFVVVKLMTMTCLLVQQTKHPQLLGTLWVKLDGLTHFDHNISVVDLPFFDVTH